MDENVLLNPFERFTIPLADWADGIKDWARDNREFFQAIKRPLDGLIDGIEGTLDAVPPTVMIAILALIAWQAAGGRTAALVAVLLTFMGLLDPRAWGLAMTTLAIVVSSVLVCMVIGLPLGVLAGKSDRAQTVLRPILDTMQTIPAFVYLVPVVMLLGIGNVPGVVVTVVFALPPLIRLTALGIRGVNPSVVEAARAFGASPRRILKDVEIPLAMPTIMAGVNQTIMLSLSMVVIASMIAVKGFGNEVLRAIGRLDAGKAIVGGLGIVILAVVLDRITQGLGRPAREHGHRAWHRRGPVGYIVSLNEKRLDRTAVPVAEPMGTAHEGGAQAAPRAT